MATNGFLFITIISPEATVFEGKIKAFSSINSDGPFDVLPQHTNFISIIKNKITLYDEYGAERQIKLENGIVEVFEDKVQVFVGIEAV